MIENIREGAKRMNLFKGGGFTGIALILVLFVLLSIVGVDN
jgi:hypothetical protein